ncbi:MAG: tRNA lysidine(34) synthetase TilS [Bryobacterales bacterium]
MLRRVAATISRYGMLSPGDLVGVAVSGGADSVALLGCLTELAPRLGVELAVVHLNHLLRGTEADADEQFVAGLAKRLNLRYFSHRVDVAAEARRAAENLEQTARRLRYQWFTELIVGGQSAKIATGHTRSDQAETVLFRLLRGSGTAGLSGIRPVVEPGFVRPLLEVSRSDVLAYLRRRGWSWRVDSTNEQTAFARNRIRHELLPSLCQGWNPRLPETLANMAQWAQAEEDYWSGIMADLASRYIKEDGQATELEARALAELPVAVQRRLLRVAIERVRGDLSAVDFGHVEALRSLAASERGGGKLDLPGLEARRSFNRLRLVKPDAGPEPVPAIGTVCLQPPGTFSVPGSGCQVRLSLREAAQTISGRADNKEGYNGKRQQALDWERLPKPLSLRIWQPGDRYQPWGRKGQKKLKSLFQEGRIAAWDRSCWPVITAPASGRQRPGFSLADGIPEAQDVVVWAHEFGPAEQYAADADSRTVLEITAFWSEKDKNLEIFP